jgi:hypothetical protein
MTEPHEQSHRCWPIVVVILATLLVFLPLCGHEFTYWDDGHTVHENPRLNPPTLESIKYHFTNISYGLYVPVTYTAWTGIAAIAQLDQPDGHGRLLNPWMFHSANVVVHATSALFAFLLIRRLVPRDGPALFGALLFALHPVQLEPVAWISGLKDVLAGSLALIALWRYVVRAQQARSDSFDYVPDLIGTLAFIGAMLAKPSAVVVVVVAGGCIRFLYASVC